jgi:hypothetical protein
MSTLVTVAFPYILMMLKVSRFRNIYRIKVKAIFFKYHFNDVKEHIIMPQI